MGKQLAAIYIRLSDEDRDKKNLSDESESIQNQRSILFEYCVKQGWEVYQIYCDEDYSGADRNRPEWLKMLRDCEAGKINIVLCKTQSRFCRDIELCEKYIHGLFKTWNVRFVAPFDNSDNSIEDNKKSMQINSLVNQWYAEDLSNNVRKTLEHKKKNGLWTGSFAPYGYATDPNDKNKLIVDSTAACIVKDIFQMYMEGKGYITIAKKLNDRKIPNPTLYKRSCGLNFRTSSTRPTSEIWTSSTISRIIRNETYSGTMVQGKRKKNSFREVAKLVPQDEWIRVPNTHEAIVDEKTWSCVQEKLAGNRIRQEKFSGSRHLLAGKVYCAVCGNSMWKMSCQLSYGRYQYYKCRTVKESNTACSNTHSVRLDLLEEIIQQNINTLLRELYDPASLDIIMPEDSAGERANLLQSERDRNLRDIAKKRNILRRIYEDLAEERLEREEGERMLKQYTDEIKNKESRNAVIDAELESLISVEKPDINDILLRFEHISELSEEIVDELVDKIIVGPATGPAREITVKWKI